MRRSSGAYIVLRVHLESIGNSAQATSKRFPFGQPAFHRQLSTVEAIRLVDQLAELGVREVTLIGGEATSGRI